MMLSGSILVTLLSFASTVSAGGYNGWSRGGHFNFGCSTQIRDRADHQQKDWCSSSGSFFTNFQGGPLCCSDHTRQPPASSNTCPFGWSQHFKAGCCIPPKEVSPCDCGEGYTYDKNAHKCVKPPGKCHGGQWWHGRSNSCCENSWEHNPPRGECPSGIKCPGGWFWHKGHKVCKPLHPRSPEPDCDDWDEQNHCCGGHTGPSQGAGKGGNKGGYGGGYGGGYKRDLSQQKTISFPQNDLDKMYCPADLHACTVETPSGGEWSYECIDFATELESCGGCIGQGGQDCTQIPHSVAVGCEVGTCAVYTCKQGYQAVNGTSCVPV
ncbi:uncharacterized protein L201_007142 [Kwoniella dendrophila CBS 6074]|uniref:Protein CPL1-like domain-containing protein n=1 Tax=Kwoniella dendrophila CBS 6074 TaxID=1295534 RepID=A0AAX4K612_9TREE